MPIRRGAITVKAIEKTRIQTHSVLVALTILLNTDDREISGLDND
jgi:hypothetical protein